MMETLKNKAKKGQGFTLVELLVVIAIIAILSVTAYVALGGQTGKARDSRRTQDLSVIQSAVELYLVNNNGDYPESLEKLVTDGDLKKMPLDPTSEEPYAYAVSDTKKEYQLGATLEGEDGSYKAYVIGNSDKPLLQNGVKPLTNDPCDPVEDGSTTCVPMKIWSE